MFNFFKEKCPVCKMELEKGKDYPQMDNKKLCSEKCKEEYVAGLANAKNQSRHSGGGCCH